MHVFYCFVFIKKRSFKLLCVLDPCPFSAPPFLSLTASWTGLHGGSTALKYALKCPTFSLTGKDENCRMNHKVSVDVLLVVSNVCLLASFFTQSTVHIQRIILCHCCEAWPIVSDTDYNTVLYYSRKKRRWSGNTLCSHSLQPYIQALYKYCK